MAGPQCRVVMLDEGDRSLRHVSWTNQATGEHSDCVLRPVFTCPDPLRGGTNVLVLCDVLNASDMKPHPTNTRAHCEKVAKKYAKEEMIYGIEQEYTMLKADGSPLGFPRDGFPAPQGPYYCGVGTGRVIGREIIEEHTQACMDAGLMIEGTNAEVMPGQWEFQIGPATSLEIGDHMLLARWLLYRIAEDFGVNASLDPKPIQGDWNGAGCHTNYSTKDMRADGGMKHILAACEKLRPRAELHIANYGAGAAGAVPLDHRVHQARQHARGGAMRNGQPPSPINRITFLACPPPVVSKTSHTTLAFWFPAVASTVYLPGLEMAASRIQ
jgi:glutamine synthetase